MNSAPGIVAKSPQARLVHSRLTPHSHDCADSQRKLPRAVQATPHRVERRDRILHRRAKLSFWHVDEVVNQHRVQRLAQPLDGHRGCN